ncbi:hypothetical protein FNV43_RR12334 [Rhamnella rubrinervis]|uniref:Cytochrome c oxidase subunit Vb n=1 Tax=Rhamnella rubrinervis TaxID=2594499 RepID=A0A8K0MI65_9ROSA|nr:hypothetical protein FNV43_RR12334 [Rhamnella rubrinervis]
MWRRVVSSSSAHLQTLASSSSWRSSSLRLTSRLLSSSSPATSSSSSSSTPFPRSSSLSDKNLKRTVEDVMPIATGHEREEIQADLEEAPAIVESYYDKRIVGCPGGEGEDEHDVVWFWLEKGKPLECPVCSQYFKLEVVGPGGPPDGHGDDDDH